MKILVIGASGMLAKPVITHLDKAGFDLRLFSRSVNASMFYKDFDIVQGDVFSIMHLEKAIDGCDAIHISISNPDEGKAVEEIVKVSLQKGIKLISMISGCTVSEENRWFWMIDNKFRAEQAIINSGISYMIFRPTWFFESLELMIRNGKANLLGKQPNPSHWVAADDYARMVVEAYKKQEARDKIFYILGPQPYLMKDLLEQYCKACHPEIKKVTQTPLGLLKFIALINRNKALKTVAEMFGYFQKTKEMGNPDEANALLGKPEINFGKWMMLKE